MNTTNNKIKDLLGEIKSLIGDSQKSMEWFDRVQAKASSFKTHQEELEYLEDILDKLKKNDGEAANEATKSNTWPAIALGVALFILVVGGAALYFLFLAPKSANDPNSSTTAASSTISKSVDLPKEDFKIVDYIVSANEIKPNPNMKNQQHKVFANGSSSDSLSDEKDVAIKEMTDYMAHNVSALKEKAMTFNIIDQNFDEKKWLEKRNGSLYYNKEGQEVFYQVKAFLSRSKITSKVMENGSNYYTTGLNKDNKVVVSQSSQDLSGQTYLEVKNPEGSTEKYQYIVLVYCGNTVLKNKVPGIPTEKIEIPPAKPGKPDKPSESKVEKKDPSKDPANQGKAPVGGGQNDGSENGTETTQAKLPESYSAPTAPSAPASSTAPAQDARISEPSQWSGAGKITDSNGTTKVTNDGSVTTPDGRNYSGLTNPSSVPPVESGANGTTAPSSSANFAGNGSMSEPAIDD